MIPIALSLVAAIASVTGAAGSPIPVPQLPTPDALVGAYYYPGWCEESRWYCIAANDKVMHPLMGYYREGSPGVADWQIKWALEHGISFFSFDFYTSNGSQMLEAALDEGFLKARFIDRFKFCLNWCNHAPASEMTEAQLERFGDLVIRKYLTHPSYLKIEGKPVVMILVGNGFVRNLGLDGAKKAYGRFEERCKEAGLPGVYLVFCEGAIGGEQDIKDAFAAGARAFCLYNYPYSGSGVTGPDKHAEMSYEHMIEQGESLWKYWRGMTDGRFWPTVMPGWDRRPWTKDLDLIRTGATPELFEKSLRKSRDYLNPDRIIMIEAWNEWGEGSVLEPSVEHGFKYLDRVREVFCPKAVKHKDASHLEFGNGNSAMLYSLRLPSADKWKFDFNADGWTGTSVSDLKSVWGALTFTTATNDPQLTSPITYLDCKRYPKLRVRMRAEILRSAQNDEAGGPKSADGQLFWSTVETGLSDAASVHFTVPLDGLWHEHDLDLSSNPNWRGRTDRLRLDPVDLAGVRVEIDEIRLLPKGESLDRERN